MDTPQNPLFSGCNFLSSNLNSEFERGGKKNASGSLVELQQNSVQWGLIGSGQSLLKQALTECNIFYVFFRNRQPQNSVALNCQKTLSKC